jgi:hypothetical protein
VWRSSSTLAALATELCLSPSFGLSTIDASPVPPQLSIFSLNIVDSLSCRPTATELCGSRTSGTKGHGCSTGTSDQFVEHLRVLEEAATALHPMLCNPTVTVLCLSLTPKRIAADAGPTPLQLSWSGPGL